MSSTSRRSALVAALLAVSLLAAACGGESASEQVAFDDAPASTASPTTVTPQTTAPAASGSGGESGGDSSDSANDAEAAPAAPAETQPEPDLSNWPTFSSMTVYGDAFESVDYAGQDVLLWFWAPW